MKTRQAVAAVVLFLVALAAPAGASAEPLYPPGSRIGLDPPVGFELSPDFMGFINPRAGSSILIEEMPAEVFDRLEARFTSESLAARGLALLGDCVAAVDFDYRCVQVAQKGDGYLIRKWLLGGRLPDLTAMVVVTIPQLVLTQQIQSEAKVEAALSSLVHRTALATSSLDALPFTIEEGALLAFERALAGSLAAYAGEAEGLAPRPLWLVSASPDPEPDARGRKFGHHAFGSITAVTHHALSGERTMAVGPLHGQLLEGTGLDARTGGETYVLQAILLDDDDRYYRMVGLAPLDEKDTYRAEFLRLIDTLEVR